MKRTSIFLIAAVFCLGSCEKVQDETPGAVTEEGELVSVEDVARILSGAALSADNLAEVRDAVAASCDNGYDEEYTMGSLFAAPGTGVGENLVKASLRRAVKTYSKPLREVFQEYFAAGGGSATKAGISAQEYLDYISSSDMQIYWPYSSEWDGETMPVITFDPVVNVTSNVGYYMDEDGQVQEITVTEELARERPVWVINRNSDADYVSLDVMRRNDPEWGQGGGLVVKSSVSPSAVSSSKALILKNFTAKRNYDCFFAGASEFWVKIGSVEHFTASTESELRLYSPSITDFMIVVRRSEVGVTKDIGTLLVSDWTSALDACALMIVEDDGGSATSWSCSAVVKYNSKSYGIELTLPFKTRDDIVWRGQMSRKYIETTSNVEGNFGDVSLTFSVVDY